MTTQRERDKERVFEYLANSPGTAWSNGTRTSDVVKFRALRDLGWSYQPWRFDNAVMDIRKSGRETGWTVVAAPTGSAGGWLYRLEQMDVADWMAIRRGSISSQLETAEIALDVAREHTSARTAEGKKVRKALREVSFVRAELMDVEL